MNGYAGQVAYVTGGASGIGLLAARRLAALGAHVVIFDRDAAAAASALRLIEDERRNAGQRVTSITLDVAEREVVLARFTDAERMAGAPDIVFHMAGVGGAAPLLDMPFADFDRMVRINVFGTRHVVEAALASMRPRGRGHLVLAGSLGGFVPIYGYTAYGTSKFAVVGFARCLRLELAPLGIAVSCFCPGETDTPGLAGERSHTHAATLALKALGGTMSTEEVVRGLLRGVARGHFLIVPGLRSRLMYWVSRLTPLPVWDRIADAIVARALRGYAARPRRPTS